VELLRIHILLLNFGNFAIHILHMPKFIGIHNLGVEM